MIAIISAADASLGQIPQNHYCLLEDIRLQGTYEQKRVFFGLALKGNRFANALSETGGKNVQDIQTRIRRDGDAHVINGRKGYCTGSLYAHWLAVLAVDEDDRASWPSSSGAARGWWWSTTGPASASATPPAARCWPGTCGCRPNTCSPPTAPTRARPWPGPSPRSPPPPSTPASPAPLRDTLAFVREHARPWIDAGVEKASEDPLTLIQIGNLGIRLEAAEALLERAGKVMDAARRRRMPTTSPWPPSPWPRPRC